MYKCAEAAVTICSCLVDSSSGGSLIKRSESQKPSFGAESSNANFQICVSGADFGTRNSGNAGSAPNVKHISNCLGAKIRKAMYELGEVALTGYPTVIPLKFSSARRANELRLAPNLARCQAERPTFARECMLCSLQSRTNLAIFDTSLMVIQSVL